MKLRTKLFLVPAVASTLLLSACATESSTSSDGASRAALVVAQGGLGDESYNDLANAGFERALASTGVTGNTIESADVVGQGEQILRRAGQSGIGVVIDLEYSHNEIIGSVASDFPDTDWVIVNAEAKGDNVASVLFQEQEGSYLAGALAAMQTTNTSDPKINAEKIIGVIGGTAAVGIDKFIVGFVQGARDIDPEVKVLTAYSNDFGDPSLGLQLAESMYEQGADIVYAVAGGTGAGVIQAAQANNHYAIGVDDNQDGIAPGYVLTSMIKRTDVAVESVLESFSKGNFPGGQKINFGLAEDGVGLTDFEFTKDSISAESLSKIDSLRMGIIDGSIKVWNVVEQGYPEFFKGK